MDYDNIIQKFAENKDVFGALLRPVSMEEYLWKPQPDKWCLLEIVCHLYDEEREDFRTRLRNALETPKLDPPPINPVGWVTERNYLGRDYSEMLDKFLEERDVSVQWLKSLSSPKWDNTYVHPKFGPMSAHFFLANWLAHDYLHIRQITRLKYDYLKEVSGETLQYAGTWI